MQSLQNRIIIAAAGAGKTETIVNEAYKCTGNVLLVTFTIKNAEEIKNRFLKNFKCIPNHVTIMTWFSFLLKFIVRPYQTPFTKKRITSINYTSGQSTIGKSKGLLEYYIDNAGRIYSDKIASLSIKFQQDYNELPLQNLGRIFQNIYVDEIQDFTGEDIDLVKALIENSAYCVTCVGDPRQSTYQTSNARKNKAVTQGNILEYFKKNKVPAQIDQTTLNTNYRCCSDICSLSDLLYTDYPRVICGFHPQNNLHVGVFLVRTLDIEDYLHEYHPMQLTYNRNSEYNQNYPHTNIGLSKGQTYDRVLVYSTKDMGKWIMAQSIQLAPKTKAMLYVALTRARYSVAFVCDYDDAFQHQIVQKFR
jgi:DNA helicase-2/ATP-dependent DNA helicase PcrA